jgi:hypothetical protein
MLWAQKKPIEPKNKTTNPTNPKTHQGFFYNLGLSNNGIKDTATPDTGYSFRVYRMASVLSVRPLMFFVVPGIFKICFNTAASIETIYNYAGFPESLWCSQKANSYCFKDLESRCLCSDERFSESRQNPY